MRALFLAVAILALPAQAQWQTVHGFAPRSTLRVPFDATGDRVVFATPDSVFSSLDGGATFVGGRLQDTIDPGNALQGAGTWDGDLLAGGTCPTRCLSRSSDGRTWTRVPIPPTGAQTVHGLAVGMAGLGDLLVVATAPSSGSATQSTLWRSTDGGATWGPAQTPVVPGGPRHLSVVSGRFFLVVDVPDNGYVGRLYTSADGDTWAEAIVPGAGQMVPMDRVDTVVESGGVLFVSPSYGLHHSTDGGATWTLVPTSGLGMNGTGYVTSLEGLGGGALTATFQGRHVRSADFGATWTDGCPLYGVGYLSDDFEAASGYLFTRAGNQIGRIDYAACGLTAPPVATEGIPDAAALRLTVAPNPSATSAALRLTLADAQTVRIVVADALGRTVLALDRALASGTHTVGLHVAALPPGVYVARVVTADGAASVRFSVAR